MAKVIKKIGSVQVSLVSKTISNTIVNGHFGGIRPESFLEHKPEIIVYVDKKVINHCGSDLYHLKEIKLKDTDSGVNVSEFYSESKDQQYKAYSRLVKIFVEFKKRFMTTIDGGITVKDYCDWDEGKKNIVQSTGMKKTTSSPSTTSSNTSSSHKNSYTTRYEKKAMFIRRKGKKLSQKSLDIMREKVAAIADGTYEYAIPCLLKTEIKAIEIDVDFEDKNKLITDSQNKINDSFDKDLGI